MFRPSRSIIKESVNVSFLSLSVADSDPALPKRVKTKWLGYSSSSVRTQMVWFNLWAPRFLYIGQAFRYSPENAFFIFNQQIYFII